MLAITCLFCFWYHKKTSNKVLCTFCRFVGFWNIMVDVWKNICNQNFQLVVVYISIYHCIMKLEQKWKTNLLFGVHFHFVIALSQCYNCKKILQRTIFMVVYPLNFADVKKQPWRIFFFTKILNYFSSCEVHIKCFKNTCQYICYNNDENCDLFKL